MNDAPKVVFRAYDDGEPVALFFEMEDGKGNIRGYSHKGRWFFISYHRIMRMTRPAVRKEYIGLFNELRGEFRGLQIYKRARIKTKYIVKQ